MHALSSGSRPASSSLASLPAIPLAALATASLAAFTFTALAASRLRFSRIAAGGFLLALTDQSFTGGRSASFTGDALALTDQSKPSDCLLTLYSSRSTSHARDSLQRPETAPACT